MSILKVSSKSNPKGVAGALAGVVQEKGSAELHAVGAAAVNQAVKAVAISRKRLASEGVELACFPTFTDVVINGKERTAIVITVKTA